MGNVKRENRLLFCALALFFFVFLESTLFFQANLAQPGELGPFFSQLPIQGASTLGLRAFPLKNRLVGEKGRPGKTPTAQTRQHAFRLEPTHNAIVRNRLPE